MFQQYLEQLNSSDSAQRRQAIIKLAQLAEPRALKYLAQRYKVESDAALRALIIKAGEHIRRVATERQQNAQVQLPVPSLPAAAAAEPPDPEPEFFRPLPAGQSSHSIAPVLRKSESVPAQPSQPAQPKPISERDRQRAKEFLDRAYGYQTSGDQARAVLMLARALRTNPSLKNERGVQGLAAALVGGDGRNSVELVLEAAERVKVKAPLFDTELIDVVIAAAVLFVMIVIFSIAVFYGSAILNLQIYSFFTGLPFDPISVQREVATAALQILPEVARNTSVTLLGTVLNLMIVYWVGTLLGGTGSVVRYLKVMLSLYVVLYLLLSIGLGMLALSLLNPSISDDLATIGMLVLTGAVLSFLGGQVYLTSRVQEFNVINAAVSVLVGSIAAGLLVTLMGFAGIPL